MKKMLILTNLLWLSVFVFMAFKPDKSIVKPNAASAYTLVNASLVDLMGINYRTNYINPSRNFGTKKVNYNTDSRSCWFGLDKLESFIADMKTANPLMNGLRFYFIQYPNDQATWDKYPYLKDISPLYKNRHTLMMIPTYFDGTYDVDFDPRKNGTDGKPANIVDVMDKLIKNEATEPNILQSTNNATKAPVLMPKGTSTSSTDDPSIINGGSLIPPPPDFLNSSKLTATPSNGIDVPCSGARLLPYFDYKSKCGFKPFTKDAIKN